MSTEPATTTDDEIIATISDYLDGVLPPDCRADVQHKIATDATWKRTHDELSEARETLSGLLKTRAPVKFDDDVTSTIHKRSAGRFFAKRTLGDRIPIGVLLIIAITVFVIIGAILWSSPTGSLKRDEPPEPPGSGALIPKP